MRYSGGFLIGGVLSDAKDVATGVAHRPMDKKRHCDDGVVFFGGGRISINLGARVVVFFYGTDDGGGVFASVLGLLFI
jgi:hypothetical protein